jgi:hypothetical protein
LNGYRTARSIWLKLLLRAQISAFRRAQEVCDFKGVDHSGTVKTSCFPVDLA